MQFNCILDAFSIGYAIKLHTRRFLDRVCNLNAYSPLFWSGMQFNYIQSLDSARGIVPFELERAERQGFEHAHSSMHMLHTGLEAYLSQEVCPP